MPEPFIRLFQKGIKVSNPFDYDDVEEPTIEYLEEDNEVCNPLSLENEERYLAQCHPILCDFAVIMIDTRMRDGEVLNLTVKDIDHCKWEIVCVYTSKPNQKQ